MIMNGTCQWLYLNQILICSVISLCVCGFFLLGTSFEYGTAERRVPRFASNRFDFSNSVETGRLQLWRKKKVGCVFRSRWQHFFPSSLDLIEQTMLFYQRPSTLWLLSHVENDLLEISVLVKVLVRCNSANQDSKFQVPKVRIEKGFFRFCLLKSKSLPGNLKPWWKTFRLSVANLRG